MPRGVLQLLFLAALLLAMSITITSLGASRVAGVAPLGVHFSATATSTAATYPWHEIGYTWDFGDAGAGTWTYTGKSKNADVCPIVAHVFETPGSYTVTLTCRDSDGTVETDTVGITVTDPDTVFSGTNTICVNKVGDSDFTGAPSGASTVNQDTYSTIIGYCAAGKRVLLKRGSTWTSGVGGSINNTGPGILGAYPVVSAGAKPILDFSAVSPYAGLLFGYSANASDWRVMDLEFQGPGGDLGILLSTYIITHITHVRIVCKYWRMSLCAHYGWTDGTTDHTNIIYYECDCQEHDGSGGAAYSFYGILLNSAFVGNYFRHGVVSNTGHTIRTSHSYKCVWAHNDIGGPGDTAQHAMKIHACNWAGEFGFPAETYGGTHCVVDNVIRSVASLQLTSFRAQNSGTDERLTDILCDGNHYLSGSGNGSTQILTDAKRTTVRNNVFVKNSGDAAGFWPVMLEERYPAAPDPADFWIYNNSLYYSLTGGSVYLCYNQYNYTGVVIRNNIICGPAASGRAVVNGAATQSNNLLTAVDPGWSTFPPTTAAHFAILTGSAAKDAGYAVPVFRDFAWTARPLNSLWDEGAYEYGTEIGFKKILFRTS